MTEQTRIKTRGPDLKKLILSKVLKHCIPGIHLRVDRETLRIKSITDCLPRDLLCPEALHGRR